MAVVTLTQASLSGRTGRGVSIAVIDSGIHGTHPHVEQVAVGVSFDDEGRIGGDIGDRLGHGTAVAAAIHEKAPDAVLVAVKVFDRALSTTGRALVDAMRWAAGSRASIINLSLGTTNHDHEADLAAAVADATAKGAIVIAAAPHAGLRWLPGALSGVLGVESDADLPRDVCRIERRPDGAIRAHASALPRPIPGVPPARNVQGPSFAVANTTGLVALAIEGEPARTIDELFERLYRGRDEGGTMPLMRK